MKWWVSVFFRKVADWKDVWAASSWRAMTCFNLGRMVWAGITPYHCDSTAQEETPCPSVSHLSCQALLPLCWPIWAVWNFSPWQVPDPVPGDALGSNTGELMLQLYIQKTHRYYISIKAQRLPSLPCNYLCFACFLEELWQYMPGKSSRHRSLPPCWGCSLEPPEKCLNKSSTTGGISPWPTNSGRSPWEKWSAVRIRCSWETPSPQMKLSALEQCSQPEVISLDSLLAPGKGGGGECHFFKLDVTNYSLSEVLLQVSSIFSVSKWLLFKIPKAWRKVSITHFKNGTEKYLLALKLHFKSQIMLYSFKEFEKAHTNLRAMPPRCDSHCSIKSERSRGAQAGFASGSLRGVCSLAASTRAPQTLASGGNVCFCFKNPVSIACNFIDTNSATSTTFCLSIDCL